MDHNGIPGSEQQQQQSQLLQPLFDSSISLPRDGVKAGATRQTPSSSPPDPNPQQQAFASGSSVFGRLPTTTTTSLDNALISHMQPQTQGPSASSGGHARTASYGTTLLDTLNEEKQQLHPTSLHYQRAAAAHQRHYSLMGDVSSQPSLSLSPPTPASGNRLSTHARAHTLTTSPPGILLRQPMPTNASGILGAHARLSSLSGLGSTTSSTLPQNAAAVGGTLQPGSTLLSSSALRSSYSSSSLRAAFGNRNSPSPLGGVSTSATGGAGADPKLTSASIGTSGGGGRSFDFSTFLDEGVWGPSRLSNELDILATPVDGSFASGNTSLAEAMMGNLNIDSGSSNAARIRSYSFNSPPEGDDGPDDPDIDVLHAAAKSQNPSLAFRKLMARTHARSKTLASPFANNNEGQQQQQQQPPAGHTHSHTHSQQQRRSIVGHARQPSLSESTSGDAAASVHIGIGGESMRAFTRAGSISGGTQSASACGSASHSRQASVQLQHHHQQPPQAHHHHHVRQPSADFDFSSFASGSDGVPTRSLWVGNVDPAMSNQDLVAQFGKYGRVESLRLLPDKECAFVNFLRVEDAISAKEDMHAGARIGNNTVRVGYGKGESYATGDAQAMQPTRALWIGNIAPAANPDSLATIFQQFGTIESARVLNHKNCGFVNFIRLEDAVRAKQAMNGKSIDGSVVRIGYAKVPAAKNESSLKLRNPVPSAAPLTVSGQLAEEDSITGTTSRGLTNDMVLEPGYSLSIDEDLVAFCYATQLPHLPESQVAIRPDSTEGGSSTALAELTTTTTTSSSGGPGSKPVLQQARLRDIRKQLEPATNGGSSQVLAKADFDQLVRELMPHAVDLCTDYVGNVLIQKIAERGDAAQKLELARRVGPHMAAIGVHKNGTWAVQKIIDTADTPEQRRVVAQSIKPYTPQLLLDQLGNYVVQGCLKFGGPTGDAASSNQFVYDAIHARCMEIAQGRFGARAIRTCLESPHATKLQQKLVAVALVTNAVALATNANGHLLMNWLLDSSKFTGRFRVLAHQLAPHLRYLATHKLGASTVTKLVDQTAEPDARDLILNTLFFNPDPSVLDDLLLDQAQGVHLILKILQGNAIGDAEKARIADRLRSLLENSSHANAPAPASSSTDAANVRASPSSSTSSSSSSSAVPPSQRLADVVAGILAHSQPVYPPTMPPAAHRASTTSTSAVQQQTHDMPHAVSSTSPPPPPHVGFHFMPHHAMSMNPAAAMSYPAVTGYGGMVAGSYYMDPLAGMAPAGFFGIDYAAGGQQRASAMPYYPYANITPQNHRPQHNHPSSSSPCSPSSDKQ
ncbi:hypothetical protein GGI17_003373 [Coemansia sp. S146]|nr:hypothetical protein GGI17_003373 [Coemansia sp. S146]